MKRRPQDKQQLELGSPWGGERKGKIAIRPKLRFWFLTALNAPGWLTSVKFPPAHAAVLLLKSKPYLTMTEHPSPETSVSSEVAELQGYANI